MKRYDDLLADALQRVREIQPWDLRKRLGRDHPPLVLDVREPAEFAAARIPGSINVPRGVLEQACEWDYDETVPELAGRRDLSIVVVCRSGKRSLLAADVMQQMGFADVVSLKTGVRGWNDFEQPLIDVAETRWTAMRRRTSSHRTCGRGSDARPEASPTNFCPSCIGSVARDGRSPTSVPSIHQTRIHLVRLRGASRTSRTGGKTRSQHRGRNPRDPLEATVRPPERLRLGTALGKLGRRAGLTDEDFAVFEKVRDKGPAEPVKFE